MSRLDCKHRHCQLVTSTRSADEYNRVHICLDCGEITVYTQVGNVHATVSFALATDVSVAAAGKWLEELKKADDNE